MAKKKNDIKNKDSSISIVKKLQQYFNIGVYKKNNQQTVLPIEKKVKDDGTIRITPTKFPDKVQDLYKYFLDLNIDNAASLQNRFNRYRDLSYMRYNSNIIWRAINMYAFEATQADSQDSVITVLARDKKIREYIYEFLAKIGITKQVLTDIAYNLALYGDSFTVNIIDEDEKKKQNVTEVIPVSPFNVKERIEFNALRIEEERLKKGCSVYSVTQQHKRLDVLAQILNEKPKNYASWFKTYLFGYHIGEEQYLPPWAVSHYRLFTTESEFYPYGRSLVIGSLSPWRQLKSLENLQQMARVFNFPTELFEVKVDETMTEIEQWNAVNQAREEYANINLLSSGNKEDQNLGKELWYAQGLINYDQKSPNFDLNQIADMEMALEKLVGSTDIPISFLIPDANGFGTSGISLTQQYKPFARTVYIIQNAILEELSNLIKLQFLISEDFPVDTPFELEMKYPVLEETSERQQAKSESISLVNDIIASITDALGFEDSEALSQEVILDIFAKYSFLDQKDLLHWIDIASQEKSKSKNGDGEDQEEASMLQGTVLKKIGINIKESTKRKIEERLNEDMILEAYFDARKRSNQFEGVKNGKHYISSFHINKKKCHDQVLNLCDKEYLNKNKKLYEKLQKNKNKDIKN